jgi:hypothetical protein
MSAENQPGPEASQTHRPVEAAQRWLLLLLAFCLPTIALSLTNCGSQDPPRPSLADPSGPTGNAGTSSGQPSSSACEHDAPGCACSLEGQHLLCGKVVVDFEKTKMCGQGVSVCTDGKWSDCVLTNAAPIPLEEAPDGYYSPQGLGSTTACPNNPCDPYCFHFPDTPDPSLADAGTNLNPLDSGLETFPDAAAGPCTPKTCAQLGKNCGPVATGCGATANCGACTAPLTCGGGGVANVCGTVATQACTPKTCAQLGKNCGPVADGCGGVLACGSCASGQTCGGGGTPSVCGVPTPPGGFCVPGTCAGLGKNCGPVSDTCGGLLQCGTCPSGQTCGGAGVPSVCGVPTPPGGFCQPKTCAQLGKNCGPASDTCGGLLNCGSCSGTQICGGGGTPGVCGGNTCTPKTCAQLGKNCGPVADGCGGLLSCGDCQSPQSCGGGGIPSKCGTSALCTGLCLQQQICPNNGTTSITGTVYAPNGVDPLPNVIVYVPNAPVPAFSAGITCDNCEQVQGSPLVSTKTAVDGTFTINSMPSGNNIPLVIQIGRWRRQVTIPSVAACQNTAISASLTRLPRNKNEGDIPKLAVSTGCVDAMECVLRKMGIQDSEFTIPSGNGRIHFYAGGICPGVYLGGGYGAGKTLAESELLQYPSKLDDYDMILFPCQGYQYYYNGGYQTVFQNNIANYVNAGGRIFTTHYNYGWIYSDGGIYQSSLSPAVNWDINDGSPSNQTGYINTSFARGALLAQWLKQPAINASSVLGQIGLNTIRSDYNSVNAPTLNWLSLSNGTPVHLTYDTPRNVATSSQCGRVVFSDFHVYDASTNNVSFPNECSNGSMSPQEKLLEYMLFDLASCVGNTPPPPPCTPTTCAAQGITCGKAGDGCGNQITCGAACPTSTCTPISCAAQGLSCGLAGDGCGNQINCGTCASPATCGGGGIPGQCGSPPPCTPITCASQGLSCGAAGNGCGGQLNCGTCTAPLTCGGGGVKGQCGSPPACVPNGCASPGVVCGQTGDGCGNTISCGCSAPQTCGGAGIPGKCGVAPACVPKTCAQQGIGCGLAGDGCGGQINCGGCTLPQTCGGGNVPGQCGALTIYNDGYFVRDYEAKCPEGTTPYWQLWSWTALTPGDSGLDFQIQTASTSAGLATAPADPLLFSMPPGPLALVNQPAVAHAANVPPGKPDTQSGAASVDYTLEKAGRKRNLSFLRVTTHLDPTTDQSAGPKLTSWDMQIDCIPSE